MEIFAKGKRSVVYLQDGKIIKKEKASIQALNRINNEATWLRLLNKYDIGPKLISSREDEITIEFVKGLPIIEWIQKNTKKDITDVLIKILHQCRTLDRLHVNKYELTNPYKHILVSRKKPVMIDFERCKYTNNPKNVTQFCQFISSGKISKFLEAKEIFISSSSLKLLLIDYKRDMSDDNFKRIIKQVFS